MALNKKAMDGVKPSMALSFKTVSHRFNPAPPYEELRKWTISQHFFFIFNLGTCHLSRKNFVRYSEQKMEKGLIREVDISAKLR
jgi:hypothetical protein